MPHTDIELAPQSVAQTLTLLAEAGCTLEEIEAYMNFTVDKDPS